VIIVSRKRHERVELVDRVKPVVQKHLRQSADNLVGRSNALSLLGGFDRQALDHPVLPFANRALFPAIK
jgi:hypothetical protein